MQTGLLMRRMACLLLLVLPFVAAACTGATPTAQVVEVTRVVPQTIVVTEVVTEIVTQIVTQPPAEPQKSLTPDAPTGGGGYASPTPPIVYTYFDDCPYSRLKVGKEAYVTYGGGANAIRETATTASDLNIVDYAQEGEAMTIIGGPVCDFGMLLWQVRTSEGVEGWTPEGNGTDYFILPSK